MHTEELIKLARPLLADLVRLDCYEYRSCYLWRDCPLYDEFGDIQAHCSGDTVYLQREAKAPLHDLFHELGHVVARKFDVLGHRANAYRGMWDRQALAICIQARGQRHWSGYLNRVAREHPRFASNGSGEVWAELFMLWFVHPEKQECRLVEAPIRTLYASRRFAGIVTLAQTLGLKSAAAHQPRRARSRTGRLRHHWLEPAAS